MYRSLSSPLFAAEIVLTMDAILLDIRTTNEISETNSLEGALHADFLEQDFLSILNHYDRWLPFLLYDQRGQRAPKACEEMLKAGFKNLAFLEGGKDAWDIEFPD